MKTNFRSFAGGEIAPEMVGRLDLTKYQTGLALCSNFVVLPHGPVTRRPGTTYVNEAKARAVTRTRLISFSYNATQTMVLEFGENYVRFHTNGQTLLEAARTVTCAGNTVTDTAHPNAVGDWVYITGRYYKVATVAANSYTVTYVDGSAVSGLTGTSASRVYTITSPYTAAEAWTIRYTQSADVMTMVAPGIPIYELRRLGSTNWTISPVSFAPTIVPPVTVTASPTTASPTTLTKQWYGVTCVAADNITESNMSSAVNCTNNLGLGGNFNTVACSLNDAALRYNFYKLRGGIYGYIGSTVAVTGAGIINISNIVQSGSRWGTTATVTTATAHGFLVGDYVVIEAPGSDFDGGFRVQSVIGSTIFTIPSTLAYPGETYSGGIVSKVSGISIIDDNILPDTANTPPINTFADTLNAGPTSAPQAVAYYEQRRWFASTADAPQSIWATRSGTESNLTYSLPSTDGDAMNFRLAATKQNAIQHLVPLNDLIALTAGGEFRIYTENGAALSPTNINVKPQGASGCSGNVQPVVCNRSAVYVQANNIRLMDISPGGPTVNYGYASSDLTLMAAHLFNATSATIVDVCYAAEPDRTVWVVRSDGTLLGLTYLPEQQVYAWHRHTISGGLVESVCAVAENNMSVLYCLVSRTLNGSATRTIERMHPRIFTADADAFHVDCGLTYSGSPATTISGLYHLEGQTVAVLADGKDVGTKTVSSGAITLSVAASKVQVGLAFTSDMTTLPLTLEAMPAQGRGTAKNINKVFLRVTQSMQISAGPKFTKLRTSVASSSSTSGEIPLVVDPSWNSDAAICVRQSGPLPLTVLSMALDVVAGG